MRPRRTAEDLCSLYKPEAPARDLCKDPRWRFLKLRSGRWFGGIAEPSELPGGGRIGYRGVDDISAARSLQEFTDDSPPVPARAQDLLPPLAVVDLGAVAEPLDRRLPRAARPHVGLARAGGGRAQAAGP